MTMADQENLSRKKKVRAAHRASATRMLAQATELMSTDGGLQPAKLKQKREALAAKAELLNKLDAEVVEAIDEDDLEEEIEAADTIRDRIELTIIELDGALDAATASGERGMGRDSTPPTRTPPARSPTPRTTPTPTRSPTPSRRLTTSRDRPGGRHTDHESTHESVPGSRESSPTSESAGEFALHHTTHIKVPKLSLKRFNGDLTRWTTFWDTFESAVHSNSTLSNIDKLLELTPGICCS